MAKYCKVLAEVRKQNEGTGEEFAQSILFKDLLTYSKDRYWTIQAWAYSRSDEFKDRFKEAFPKDINGEPTIEFIENLVDLGAKVGKDFITTLGKNSGLYTNAGISKFYISESKLKEDIDTFENTSPFRMRYKVTSKKVSGETPMWTLKIERKEANEIGKGVFYQINQKNKQHSKELNTKIKEKLAQFGISIGALTETEKALGVSGVLDTDLPSTFIDGMNQMIRLAEGVKGAAALPEEFSHFVVESMEDTPLVQRYLNTIIEQDMVGDIFGDSFEKYNQLYEEDSYKMAKEALGKLIANHLLRNQETTNVPVRSLFDRIVKAFKAFISSKKFGDFVKEINSEKLALDKELSQFTKNIMAGEFDLDINKNNISSTGKFYQAEEEITSVSKAYKKLLDTEVKRKFIYEGRKKGEDFDKTQEAFIKSLEDNYLDENYLEGIQEWIVKTTSDLTALKEKMDELIPKKDVDVKETARLIRDIRNYISAYKAIQKELYRVVNESRREDTEFAKLTQKGLTIISDLINSLEADYNELSLPVMKQWLTPYVGNSLEVMSKKYNKNITLDYVLEQADEDISWFDMMMNSMGDSNDILLQVMDTALKDSKENIRLKYIDISKRIQALQLELEQSGENSTAWMLETNKNGKLTGNYVSEVNETQFKEDKEELYKKLRKEYKANDRGRIENYHLYSKEVDAWMDAHTEEDGSPKRSMYINPEFVKIQTNPAKLNYYTEMLAIKEELNNLLPEKYTVDNPLLAVQIKKGLTDRLKNAKSFSGGFTELFQSLKDEIVKTEDETEFGVSYNNMDFEGKKILSLPVYFTRKIEKSEDISTDITSTMLSYAAMALNFDGMHEVVDMFELGRQVIADRVVGETKGDNKVMEKFKSMGRTVSSTLYKKGELSNIMQKYETWMLMQVYGQLKKDDEKYGKTADFVNRMTSITNLGFNGLQNISNIATGSAIMNVEAFAGEFFGKKALMKADIKYFVELPPMLGEVGNRVKVSKLALFEEMFNTLDKGDMESSKITMNKNDFISTGFNPVGLSYLGMKAGEHFLHNRTALAMSEKTKLKGPDGQLHSLYDSMEVIPIVKKGKVVGGKIQVKEGFTKEDGGSFTKEDIIKFTKKVAGVNRSMHGIYNQIDRNIAQHYAVGRMALMFRKWMVPNFNKRFQKGKFNFDTESYKEGYYRYTAKFLKQIVKELRQGQFHIQANWNNLDAWEKSNMKRAITETVTLGLLSLSIMLLDFDSDDKERSWGMKMLEYQMKRLRLELGAMTPTNPLFFKNITQLMSSPAAGVNYIEKAVNLLNFPTYFDKYQTGRYKDNYKFVKYYIDMAPFANALYKTVDPEVGLPFLEAY